MPGLSPLRISQRLWPLAADIAATTATACQSGINGSQTPKDMSAVPKPARPLIKPPAAAPNTSQTITYFPEEVLFFF